VGKEVTPAAAKQSAADRQIPLLSPVTTATLPFSPKSVVVSPRLAECIRQAKDPSVMH